jgi:hypothetical protein
MMNCHGSVARRWVPTPEELDALADYNRSKANEDNDRRWKDFLRSIYQNMYLTPMTLEEAERAYDEAEPVPISEERLQEIVDYATGKKGN